MRKHFDWELWGKPRNAKCKVLRTKVHLTTLSKWYSAQQMRPCIKEINEPKLFCVTKIGILRPDMIRVPADHDGFVGNLNKMIRNGQTSDGRLVQHLCKPVGIDSKTLITWLRPGHRPVR